MREKNVQNRLTNFAAAIAALALAACGQAPQNAPEAAPAAATQPETAPNAAPLAYVVSQHSPLLDAAAQRAISQDFNGAPLSGARSQHQVTAKSVRCRSLNPPSGVPECAVTYAAGQEIAITGEDATALFAALAAAGVQDEAGMGHITRKLTALDCMVDDAVAQDTPATGDQVAGFACRFSATD
jgi:hypothetical protein